jgi:hypothetical protein
MSEENTGPAAGTNPQSATQTVDTRDMAELEADIARTREDLATTVDELAAKLDVKTRVLNRIADTKSAASSQIRSLRGRATGDDGQPTPAALFLGAGVATAITGAALARLWMRSDRPSRSWRRR